MRHKKLDSKSFYLIVSEIHRICAKVKPKTVYNPHKH